MFQSALIYLKTKLRPQIAHKNCRVVIEIIGIADRIKCGYDRNMIGERQIISCLHFVLRAAIPSARNQKPPTASKVKRY